VPLERMAVVIGNNEPYARLLHDHLELAGIAHKLADARINIEYCYSATPPDAKKGLMVMRVSNASKALKALNS